MAEIGQRISHYLTTIVLVNLGFGLTVNATAAPTVDTVGLSPSAISGTPCRS